MGGAALTARAWSGRLVQPSGGGPARGAAGGDFERAMGDWALEAAVVGQREDDADVVADGRTRIEGLLPARHPWQVWMAWLVLNRQQRPVRAIHTEIALSESLILRTVRVRPLKRVGRR